jgi:uncharacterized protein involved in outer membrane biogenesis
MLKKVLIGFGVLVLIVALGLFFWTRAILASDPVRHAVAAQLSTALGQPVTIGSIGATILPRTTMTLDGVRIGQPARITLQHLHMGTSLGALLSRRIEHARVELDGARIELPLPAFSTGSSAGTGSPGASGSAGAPPSPSAGGSSSGGNAGEGRAMPIEIVSIDDVSVDNVEIVSGGLTLEDVSGHARATANTVTFDPITFGVFGGEAKGSLALTSGATTNFRLHAKLSDVDLKKVMAFAGEPGLMTGSLSGAIDATGRGTTAETVLRTSRGTAKVEATDGSVKGLGLVRALVLATSMRSESTAQLRSTSVDEPFSRMGGSFTIGGGTATTRDLRFESRDVTMSAVGTMRLDGSAIHLTGPVRLSEALTKQAGRDLVRYTAQDGRVTLPIAVTGSAQNLHVGLDTAALTKGVLSNSVKDALKKLIPKIPRP